MKLYKKLTKIGTGYWILVPQKFIKANDLKENELIEVELSKFSSDELTEYRCNICCHTFGLAKNEIPYCPSCEEENPLSFTIVDNELIEEQILNDENIELNKIKLGDMTINEFLSSLTKSIKTKGGEENGR